MFSTISGFLEYPRYTQGIDRCSEDVRDIKPSGGEEGNQIGYARLSEISLDAYMWVSE